MKNKLLKINFKYDKKQKKHFLDTKYWQLIIDSRKTVICQNKLEMWWFVIRFKHKPNVYSTVIEGQEHPSFAEALADLNANISPFKLIKIKSK